ncbi:MAG: FlgD immunoglobulin-like domain containing protein [Candidatus Krumholzibacteriia bacterium]
MNMIRSTARLAAAVILLASAASLAQTPVAYRCRKPRTGSPVVQYRWYICRPDSNTLIFATATTETFATLLHQYEGERVRVLGVDARNRVGRISVASADWSPEVPTGVPPATTARLWSNYPNPFNPETSIPFTLPQPARTRMTIYDLAGRTVRVLVNAVEPAGNYEIRWDGTSDSGQQMPSGVYLCRLEAGSYHATRQMTLVR